MANDPQVALDLTRARREDPETSKLAAQEAAELAERQYAAIVERLRVLKTRGATGGELDETLHWPSASAGRRLPELWRRGRIERLIYSRPNPVSRRYAHIHVLPEFVDGRPVVERPDLPTNHADV